MTFLKSPTWAELGCELTFAGVQAPCAATSITLRPTQHHVTLRQELPGCPGDKGCLVSRVPPSYEAPVIPPLDYISLAKAWPRPAVMQVQSGGESHSDPAAFACAISQGRRSDPLWRMEQLRPRAEKGPAQVTGVGTACPLMLA